VVGGCAHRKVAMTPSAPVRHAVSTTASAAVLALAFGLFPAGPALAATTEPTPVPASDTQAPSDCGLICMPILASSPDSAQPGRPRKSKEPVAPPAQPVPPAEPPAQPAQPVQPPPPQADIQPPDPAAVPATAEAVPEPAVETASAAAGYRPPTGPSSGQDWNSPVTRSAAPAQMAAAAPTRGRGSDGPALLPIVAGAVLLSVSAGAFVWWNRNRLRSH
jgi:hypothetical protein